MASVASTKTFHVALSWHNKLKGGSELTHLKHCSEELGVIVRVNGGNDTSVILMSDDAHKMDGCVEYLQSVLGFKMSECALVTRSIHLVPLEMQCVKSDHSRFMAMVSQDGCAISFSVDYSKNIYSLVQGTEDGIQRLLDEISKMIHRRVTTIIPKKKRSVVKKSTMAMTSKKKSIRSASMSKALFFHPFEDDEADFNELIATLLSAKSTLDLCVFSLTDNRIRYALTDLRRKGVSVRMITDNSQSLSLGSDAEWLDSKGIPVKVDFDPKEESHMHHKFAIIDSELLLTGSFNWTWSASHKNYENIAITDDVNLVRCYSDYFNTMFDHDESIVDIQVFLKRKSKSKSSSHHSSSFRQ